MKKILTFLILLGFLFIPFSVFGGGVVLNEEEGVYRPDAPLNFSAYINYKEGKLSLIHISEPTRPY